MNFEDEDYRRQYVRRTVTSKRLGWEGRAVRNEMLTEFDRAGVWECGEDPAQDIAELVELPIKVVRAGLAKLFETRTWVRGEGQLVWPRYVDAQTCARSDRIRQQESRERRRLDAIAKTAKLTSHVTERHTMSQPSQIVTPPSLALPPSLPPERESDARAREEQSPCPEVPGLVVVHPGPLQPSKRDRELSAHADAIGKRQHRFTKGWRPVKANRDRALEIGLEEADLWQRWDECRDKHYQSGFPLGDDEGMFNRELAWAKADKEKLAYQRMTKSERQAFELPGHERRPA